MIHDVADRGKPGRKIAEVTTLDQVREHRDALRINIVGGHGRHRLGQAENLLARGMAMRSCS